MSIEWKEAVLRLSVTPHVIDKQRLRLDILAMKEEFDESKPPIDGQFPKTTKKATTATGRLVVVWTVRDHLRRVVKTYAYHDQADAEKQAARLTKSSGKEHVVRRDRAPMEE